MDQIFKGCTIIIKNKGGGAVLTYNNIFLEHPSQGGQKTECKANECGAAAHKNNLFSKGGQKAQIRFFLIQKRIHAIRYDLLKEI